MNITKPLTAIAIAITFAGTHAAVCAQQGKSREQVRAELADAVRMGDIVTGDSGLKLNQIWPALYPSQVESPGKNGEQLRAELNEVSTDRGYALYRHAVLGYSDDMAGAVAATQRAQPQRTEGSYARYLTNNGFAKGDARAAAQLIGEQPREASEKPAPQKLTSYEAYRMVVLGQRSAAVPATTTN